MHKSARKNNCTSLQLLSYSTFFSEVMSIIEISWAYVKAKERIKDYKPMMAGLYLEGNKKGISFKGVDWPAWKKRVSLNSVMWGWAILPGHGLMNTSLGLIIFLRSMVKLQRVWSSSVNGWLISETYGNIQSRGLVYEISSITTWI